MADNFTAHTRMLIQRLQKWWIENPSLLTCVKAIQNFAYGVVLDCFYTHEIGLDFSLHHFLSNFVPKLTLALWQDVGFFESFYGELDISREILLILKKHIPAKVMSPIMQY